MDLGNYQVFVKPNKWAEPKYARPFYDIYNKSTGRKYRIAASDLWNTPEKLISIFGEDALPISEEIIKREKDIELLKEKYLELYTAVKNRYDSGMKIPRKWVSELEDMFDEMYNKDASLGNFSSDEDTVEGLQEKEKLMSVPVSYHAPFASKKKNPVPVNIASAQSAQMKRRSPETEAPHMIEMPDIRNQMVDEDDFYHGMNMQLAAAKLSRKCGILLELEKDDVSATGTAGATPISGVGYVGATGANTETPGYRNVVYDKKKKKKEKQFMKAHGFVNNIEDLTNRNKAFRHVLYTGKKSQLVIMSLEPGEEIGMETHEDTDQFFRVDSGVGMVIIDGHRYKISDGTGIVVPAGAKHNVINISKDKQLKLYTIYSPPEHKDETLRQTREAAENNPEQFDGKTTEISKMVKLKDLGLKGWPEDKYAHFSDDSDIDDDIADVITGYNKAGWHTCQSCSATDSAHKNKKNRAGWPYVEFNMLTPEQVQKLKQAAAELGWTYKTFNDEWNTGHVVGHPLYNRYTGEKKDATDDERIAAYRELYDRLVGKQ